MMSADTSTIVASVDSVLVENFKKTAEKIASHCLKNTAGVSDGNELW